MKFLADESCDFAAIRSLRKIRHDVVSVSEICSGAGDETVLEIAAREKRILLTEDKDFGNLVFAQKLSSSGVILIRFPVSARPFLGETIARLVEQEGKILKGSFTTVTPEKVRVVRLP